MPGKGGARAGAGRPKKPTIALSATKGVASAVLASIDEQQYWRRLLRTDLDETKFLALPLADRRHVEETLEYLTDRRDGKPAQGVFVGDTRESERPVDHGFERSSFGSAAANPRATNKPN